MTLSLNDKYLIPMREWKEVADIIVKNKDMRNKFKASNKGTTGKIDNIECGVSVSLAEVRGLVKMTVHQRQRYGKLNEKVYEFYRDLFLERLKDKNISYYTVDKYDDLVEENLGKLVKI